MRRLLRGHWGVENNLHWPLDWPMEPRLRAVLYAIPQAITIGLAVLALRRRVGTPEGATLTV